MAAAAGGVVMSSQHHKMSTTPVPTASNASNATAAAAAVVGGGWIPAPRGRWGCGDEAGEGRGRVRPACEEDEDAKFTGCGVKGGAGRVVIRLWFLDDSLRVVNLFVVGGWLVLYVKSCISCVRVYC